MELSCQIPRWCWSMACGRCGETPPLNIHKSGLVIRTPSWGTILPTLWTRKLRLPKVKWFTQGCGGVCSVAQSCLTLWDPTEYSPTGSSVHGISQARLLEQVSISSSKGSFLPRDWNQGSASPALVGRFFTTEPPGKPLPKVTPNISSQVQNESQSCFIQSSCLSISGTSSWYGRWWGGVGLESEEVVCELSIVQKKAWQTELRRLRYFIFCLCLWGTDLLIITQWTISSASWDAHVHS